MRAIDFIEKDISRTRLPVWVGPVFYFGLLGMAATLGLGLRKDFVEAFRWANLRSPVLGSFVLLAFPWVYLSSRFSARSRYLMLGALIATSLWASLIQPQTEISLQKFLGPDSFWPEAFHCLAIGVPTSVAASIVVAWFFRAFFPTPNRTWRVLASWLPSLTGLTALSFHCMGGLHSHIFVAHWGQGLVAFPFSIWLQNQLLKSRLQQVIGESSVVTNRSSLAD